MTTPELPSSVRLARNVLVVLTLLVALCGVAAAAAVVLVIAWDPTLQSGAWISGVVFAVPVVVVWLIGVIAHLGVAALLHQGMPAGRWLTVGLGVLWLGSPLFVVGIALIWAAVGDPATRAWWAQRGSGASAVESAG